MKLIDFNEYVEVIKTMNDLRSKQSILNAKRHDMSIESNNITAQLIELDIKRTELLKEIDNSIINKE